MVEGRHHKSLVDNGEKGALAIIGDFLVANCEEMEGTCVRIRLQILVVMPYKNPANLNPQFRTLFSS